MSGTSLAAYQRSVAQPGRIRREDGGCPSRLPEGQARRRQAAAPACRVWVPAGAATARAGRRRAAPRRTDPWDACGRERPLVARTRERYAEIHGRLDARESLSAISCITGLDRKTVQRFARAGNIEGQPLGFFFF